MNHRTIGFFVLLLLSSCNQKTTSDGETIFCTASVDPAIRIEVFDMETGQPNSCGAKATIADGNFSEVVENFDGADCNDSIMLTGADERAGTYNISVVKDDYLEWNASNIQVTANICHVNTITLQAYLDK